LFYARTFCFTLHEECCTYPKGTGREDFFNMLGPMVNPAFPTRQLVGVFSLELARQYGYLYQQSGKDFVILHSTAGYDENLTNKSFSNISHAGESLLEPEDFKFTPLDAFRFAWRKYDGRIC